MRWHVFKRNVGIYWRKRWIRVSTSVLVLSLTISVQYYLARIPQSLDVGANDSKYTPAKCKVKQQEIVIHNPVMNSKEEPLLSFDGKLNQTVEFHSAKAKLSEDTFIFLHELLRGEVTDPPADFEKIDYFVEETDQQTSMRDQTINNRKQRQSGRSGSNDDSCRMFIRVDLINDKMPTEVHFYQPEAGTEKFQSIEITAKDADLAVSLKQKQPDSEEPKGDPWARGCKKTLVVKDWTLPNNGEFELTLIVKANSTFRFDFQTSDPKATLESGGSLFEALRFGGQYLKAKAISVITTTKDASSHSTPPSPILEVQATTNKGLLTINNLKAGAEQLHLDFSGIGVVKSNGEAVKTLSIFDLVTRYPLVAALFGLANAALLGWITRAIFGKKLKSAS